MRVLNNRKVLLTGATGGIGSQLSIMLAKAGASQVLSSSSRGSLESLELRIKSESKSQAKIELVEKDLLKENAAAELVQEASQRLHGLDMVINLAGTQTFRSLSQLSAADIQQQITVNLQIPIQICREAMNVFDRSSENTIVNIGSVFGSIGFSQHSVYCASKFGLRGFSESLRRELQDTGIRVLYIAPRATRTSLNSQQVYDMANAAGTAIDEPALVAKKILDAIRRSRPVTSIGQPESLACRINGLFPVLFDKILRKQSRMADDFANPEHPVRT